MLMLKQPPRTPATETALNLYRLTVAQFHRMNDAGIIQSDDRVELLEGFLVQKMTPNPPHAVTVQLLDDFVRDALPKEWRVRVQQPITLSDSEPESDLAVVRGPTLRYADLHPGPADIVLVVEVADTTLESDRTYKSRLFARARLPVYWIVNLVGRVIEAYSQPKAGKSPAYRHRQDYGPDDKLPLVIAGKQIAVLKVADLLPRRLTLAANRPHS